MAQQPEEENLLADEGAPGAAPEEGVELQTVKLEEMAPVVRGPQPHCRAERDDRERTCVRATVCTTRGGAVSAASCF